MCRKFAFLFLAFAMVLSACRKDSDITTPNTIDPGNLFTTVTAGLIGNVIYEDFDPVEGAIVKLKNNITTTDEYGNFFFSNVQMEVDGALITVENQGSFKAFDRVSATEGQTSFTRIQLLGNNPKGSFQSSDPNDISFDGATVKFQPNSFVDASGNDYNGLVKVAGHWIDPTGDALEMQMPGDLRALDLEGQDRTLQSFGMVAVDLFDENGGDLQLKEGMTAEINFPIPEEISNSAPATIPLWSFDEENGLWVEEGTATKVGNMYVGNVSHFSFWNCDAPFPVVQIEGQLVAENGDPLPGTSMCIEFADNSVSSRGGWTNEEGFFGGKIPKDELLVLSVKDDCYNTVFTMDIGPFSQNVDLGQITVSGTQANFISVTGTLVDCDSDPVTNGYVRISIPGTQYSYYPSTINADGSWETQVLICEDVQELWVAGYDLDAQLISTTSIVNVISGTSTYDVGVLEVCEQSGEYLITETDSGTMNYSFFDPGISFQQDSVGADYRITIEGGSGPNGLDSLSSFQLYFIMNGAGPGTYSGEYINFSDYDISTGNDMGYYCEVNCNLVITITQFENVGGFVEGSYTGSAVEFPGSDVTVNGTFRIKRE